MTRHDELRTLLPDFVDGELSPADAEAVGVHAASCDECAAETDALHALRAAAQDLPPEIAPDGDLWPGVAARLDAPAVGDPESATTRSAPPWARFAWVAAAAVAALLLWPGHRTSDDAWRTDDLDAGYAAVRDDARATRATGTVALDAEGGKAYDEGLAAIDAAVQETREALRTVADGPGQILHLAESYQRKIDLLQRLARRAARP